MTGQTVLYALLALAAVMLVAGRAGTLASRLLLAIVGAVLGTLLGLAARLVRGLLGGLARRLGFGWPQWLWLAATVLLVRQAAHSGVPPRAAWTAAAFAWAAWLAVHVRAAHRRRTAPKRYAKALRTTAEAMEASARTPTATRAASRARRAAKAATRTAEPLPAPPPPTAPAAPATVKDRAPPAPYWTPGETPLEPILPRWLGGWWRQRRRSP